MILVSFSYSHCTVTYRFVRPRPKTKTTYASQPQSLPALTASLLHTSFPHYLSSFPVLGQHLPTQCRQRRGSRTRTFLSHFSFSFVRLPFLYSIPFTGASRGHLYDTKLRHSRQVARMYLSYSSSRASSFSIEKPLCLSPFISYSLVCFFRSRRPLCGTAVHGISAAFSCVFSPLSPAWTILSPSQ